MFILSVGFRTRAIPNGDRSTTMTRSSRETPVHESFYAQTYDVMQDLEAHHNGVGRCLASRFRQHFHVTPFLFGRSPQAVISNDTNDA